MSDQFDFLDEIAADLQLDAVDTAGILSSPNIVDNSVHNKEVLNSTADKEEGKDTPDGVVASKTNGSARSMAREAKVQEADVKSIPPFKGVKSKKTHKIITDNKERCRRHRQKKREAEEKVYTDNVLLKQERARLAKKLTELQLEVQTLRGQAVVDLSKENELIKVQIKKHRRYIEKVVKVALTTPLEVDEIENQRLMRSAVESGVGQIVGLAYSSLHSEAWQRGAPFKFNFSTFDVPEITPLFQYLPIGSTAETASRLVVRWDINRIPVCWEVGSKAHASYMEEMSNADTLREYWARIPEMLSIFKDAKICPIPAETRDICCFAAQVKGGDKTKQVVMAFGFKDTEMYPSAFSPDETDDPFQAQKVRICLNTAVDAVPPDDSSIETMYAMSIDGSISRVGPNDTTNLTYVQSWPMNHGFSDLLLHGIPLLDDKTKTLNPQYMQYLNFLIEDMLQRTPH